MTLDQLDAAAERYRLRVGRRRGPTTGLLRGNHFIEPCENGRLIEQPAAAGINVDRERARFEEADVSEII